MAALAYDFNRLSYVMIVSFTVILVLYGTTLGISFDEAKIFFSPSGTAAYLARASVGIFGQNDFAIRLPFILVHSIAAVFFWKISLEVCKRPSDAFLALALFLLLPGLNLVALLVSKASLLLLLGLATTYFLIKNRLIIACTLIAIGAFSDNGFAAFLLGVAAWAFSDRKYKLGIFVAALFLVCMIRFGFNDGGAPQGWFLETIGSYFALFSPIVFVFYLYSLFKLRKNPDLLWQISFWSVALSLILSLRQRVPLVDYAPYSAFALPLAIGYFSKQWHTKLPEFRLRYKIGGIMALGSLIIWSALSFFLQNTVVIFDNPRKSPIWPHLVAKELAYNLHSRGINAVDSKDKDLQLRLKWYGIEHTDKVLLSNKSGDIAMPIVYSGKIVTTYYLTPYKSE